MTAPEAPRRPLPDRPSEEFLRKEAKRLAKAEALALAAAQRKLAMEYGFSNWAELMRAVADLSVPKRSPLSIAALRADEAAVRALLKSGGDVDGEPGEIDTPLFCVCGGDAPSDKRVAVAGALIEAGAFIRAGCTGGATALHAAARRGPAALVELLLRNGALFWQSDDKGLRPYDYALNGEPADRDRILYLCADGPKIEDPVFRSAVGAIQSGDISELQRLLDAHPRLLHERAVEPEIGPRGYFSDPKLFWFIANNPTLIPEAPVNIVEIAEEMIARGVDQADLDYALGLVMTNGMMAERQQIALVETLTRAGAKADAQGVLMTLGHRQTAPVIWLLDHGLLITAPIAAALGKEAETARLLAGASLEMKNEALAMASINRQVDCARLCLEAGADPNVFMPCHSHSTPLHQAALEGDIGLLKLLLKHGARLDIEDTMWRGTPLGWSIHGKQREAEAILREAAKS